MTKLIDSLEMLQQSFYVLLKHKDMAEMMSVFVAGRCDAFWVFLCHDEKGENPVPYMDYSLMNGGGWVNIGCTVQQFVEGVDGILKDWPLTEEMKELITKEKIRLMEHAKKSIEPEHPNPVVFSGVEIGCDTLLQHSKHKNRLSMFTPRSL